MSEVSDFRCFFIDRFKFLAEQYELRERQLEKLNEQIKLETQLNEAKLAKIQMEATIEREVLLKWVGSWIMEHVFPSQSINYYFLLDREKQSALEEIIATNKTVLEMQAREKALKEQLSLYTTKYEEFQNSLKSSSEIFNTYKMEIEKVGTMARDYTKKKYLY